MSRAERTRRAIVDAAQIWVYVAERNFAAAERLLDRFDSAIQMLVEHPHAGESVDHLHPGVRRYTVGNYSIYFEPLAGGIRVWRILHSARAIEGLLDDI